MEDNAAERVLDPVVIKRRRRGRPKAGMHPLSIWLGTELEKEVRGRTNVGPVVQVKRGLIRYYRLLAAERAFAVKQLSENDVETIRAMMPGVGVADAMAMLSIVLSTLGVNHPLAKRLLALCPGKLAAVLDLVEG